MTAGRAALAGDELAATLARRFADFAALDGQDDPLYAAIARAIAADPSLTALLSLAPSTQQKPVLLLAAIHDRLLAGVEHPLRAYYASVGGHRAPDDELPRHLADFLACEHDALAELVRHRTTQTNEIGRCAVLRPVLQALADRLGGSAERPLPLALFDFGCSAGLNLGVDAYGYDDGVSPVPAPTPDAPTVSTTWRHGAPRAVSQAPHWRLTHRLGADLDPIDPADDNATRWLRACLWPAAGERRDRLDRALALARRRGDRLLRTEDGLTALAQWLDELPAGTQPVLLNIWVLAYFDDPALRDYQQRVADLVRRRGLAWISAEMGRLAPLPATPPAPEGESADDATLWTLQWRDGDTLRTEPLASSHAHGRWVQWLDGTEATAPTAVSPGTAPASA